ncbi:hypothetical protein HII36_28795 [Nonomuraea sp. NN258]|uniref:hypothetical protein n=1 Tax=Nonomuraea antri TaxID=2730852 RepID=UPI001569D5ED|nr:hypothetical protein [Nonomuraea antri]NRQ35803.1 hypothetical protein [Nonomuraea antri]
MTIARPVEARAPVAAGTGRRRVSPGWAPAALVLAAAVGLLCRFEVPPAEVAWFAGYLAAGVVLPGTLLWRALGCGGGLPLPADLAAGLALGYAAEVAAYLVARAAGVPQATPLWAVAVIAVFLAVPRLRACWRGGGGARVPLWWAWTVSAFLGYFLARTAAPFFRSHGLTAPGNGFPYVDLPYHLALLGELKHHLPPELPSVLGERLSYHWFGYAEMAATSWATGIEPQTLLYRLSGLPMLAASVTLLAVIAWRLTRRWWPGVAALGLICFASSPEPHGIELFTGRPLFTTWISPTQAFGTVLFAAVVLLLTGCLHGGRRPWAAVAVLLLALTGAKATFLPLLLGGLVLALAVRWAADRRPHRRTLAAIGITLACLAVAQLVVFAGARQGMGVDPLATMRRVWGVAAGLNLSDALTAPLAPSLWLAVVGLGCLACVYAGAFGLVARLELVRDPVVLTLAGIGLSGIGAVFVLGHPAASQLYFLEGARPYLALAAAVGCWALVARETSPRWWARPAMALAAGAGVAAAVAYLLGLPLPIIGVPEPVLPVRVAGEQALPVVLPYLVLAVVVLGVRLLLRPPGVVMLALVTGFLVPSAHLTLVPPVSAGTGRRTVPDGALEAGRWLRDHSRPDDVVATNAHCRPPGRRGCDSRHFWVAGYTERRVLIEGWAYAESTLARAPGAGVPYLDLPYADQARLAANDAAFRAPTPETLRRLNRAYGVRWLLVDASDRRSTPPLAELGRHAALRFRHGDCLVYQI